MARKPRNYRQVADYSGHRDDSTDKSPEDRDIRPHNGVRLRLHLHGFPKFWRAIISESVLIVNSADDGCEVIDEFLPLILIQIEDHKAFCQKKALFFDKFKRENHRIGIFRE
jgi:hypothetical protein